MGNMEETDKDKKPPLAAVSIFAQSRGTMNDGAAGGSMYLLLTSHADPSGQPQPQLSEQVLHPWWF